jgi:hypothetical protein
MKPYGLRCKRHRCSLKIKGDPATLWKKHAPNLPMPPLPQPLPQRGPRSARAARRAEHRARVQGVTLPEKQRRNLAREAAEAASRQFSNRDYLRESGVQGKSFQGPPAWGTEHRPHASSKPAT